jgi:hypothetical protein
MSIKCHHFNVIVPKHNIDKVYSGGFEAFKKDNEILFEIAHSYDDDLVCFTSMGVSGVDYWIGEWEDFGLVGVVDDGESKKWIDFCVVGFSGPTFECDWLVYNKEKHEVKFQPI